MSTERESRCLIGYVLNISEIEKIGIEKEFFDQEYLNKNEGYYSAISENFAEQFCIENLESYAIDEDCKDFVIGFSFNYIEDFDEFMVKLEKYKKILTILNIEGNIKLVNLIFQY